MERDRNGGRKSENQPRVTIPPESDLQKLDDEEEDVCFTGPWRTDPELSTFLQQHLINGVSVPISEVPTFGQVCVKDSTNVHFGDTNIYNDGVTITQIFYPNPNSLSADNEDCDDDEIPEEEAAYSESGDQNLLKSENLQVHRKVKKWLMCAVVLSVFIIAVVVFVVLIIRDRNDPPAPDRPRIITRSEWKGQPPIEPLIQLKLPVPYAIISHTETDFCQTQSICSLRVRMIQTQNIEVEHFSDIGYNFLVGGDGNAYEGRGWDFLGAHARGYNARSIGISFIGNFSSVVPPDRQLLAAQQLIELGVHKGKVALDYKLLGHRQVSNTTSPGDVLYNIIKTWPHWYSQR